MEAAEKAIAAALVARIGSVPEAALAARCARHAALLVRLGKVRSIAERAAGGLPALLDRLTESLAAGELEKAQTVAIKLGASFRDRMTGSIDEAHRIAADIAYLRGDVPALAAAWRGAMTAFAYDTMFVHDTCQAGVDDLMECANLGLDGLRVATVLLEEAIAQLSGFRGPPPQLARRLASVLVSRYLEEEGAPLALLEGALSLLEPLRDESSAFDEAERAEIEAERSDIIATLARVT